MKPKRTASQRILKFARFLFYGLALLLVSYIFLFPQLFSCQTISLSEFHRIQDRIYVSPEVVPGQHPEIREVIGLAVMRIDSFYSGNKSKPVFIICTTSKQYQKYCSGVEGAGCSVGTPWGASYVVVNLQGINVDVISHELSHAELLARLGWMKVTFEVPQWFNEGLALMLDRRFVNNADPIGRYMDYNDEWLYYTRGGQIIQELNEIASLSDFFSGSQKDVMLAYMTSGLEISYWLACMKNDGFKKFLSLSTSGSSFDEAYMEAEKQNLSAHAKSLPVNPLRR